MAGNNGYGTLDQLRGVRRLEKDFTDWPEMKLRIQALTDDEIRLIQQRSADKDDPNGVNMTLDRKLQIVYGLATPRLDPYADLDGALEAVSHIPVGVQVALSAEILGLTYRRPQEAFKDFGVGEGSPVPPEAIVSGSSS